MLLGNGDGTFSEPSYFASIAPGFVFVAAADLNGDGKDDVIGSGLTVDVLLGVGNGNFLAAPEYDPNGLNPIHGLARDLNGDGIPDLAMDTINDSSLLVVLGRGDGTFLFPGTFYETANLPSELTSGDFNNDRKIDIAVKVEQGVSILLGNGDGTFQQHLDFGDGDAIVDGIALGDFNKDGNLDVAVANASNVGVLLGKGDGTMQPEKHYEANRETQCHRSR